VLRALLSSDLLSGTLRGSTGRWHAVVDVIQAIERDTTAASVAPLLERAGSWPLAASISGAVALLAWRANSLTRGGAMTALLVGTIAIRTAWGWGAYVVVWFGLASLLSRIGRARKAARVGRIVVKGERRDSWQVLANGGVFAAAALAAWLAPAHAPACAIVAASALAAAGADTWSTEVGTLVGKDPWSLRLRTTAPAGTSGAVSWAGSLGGFAGALVLAATAATTHVIGHREIPAVVFGALVGAWTDTALGAWWQVRYCCPTCGEATEQELHCGDMRTVRVGGIGALDNDLVNLVCTIAGALAALSWWSVSPNV
jgi:uncharacterized protein (TIGR00297 family)